MSKIKTLTVAQLIERLREEDPDALVVFASDYGDRGHTQQAHFLDGRIQEQLLVPSAYSGSGFALSTEDDDEDDSEAIVLVLS